MFFSVATDGARSMTDRMKGAVLRLESVAFPNLHGIFCVAREIKLVVQSLMADCLRKTFREPLVALISYLASNMHCNRKWVRTSQHFT